MPRVSSAVSRCDSGDYFAVLFLQVITQRIERCRSLKQELRALVAFDGYSRNVRCGALGVPPSAKGQRALARGICTSLPRCTAS